MRALEVRSFTTVFRDVGQIIDFLRATTYGQRAPGAAMPNTPAFARQRKRYWLANTRTARVTKESAWNATSCLQSRRNRTDDPVVPS